MGDILLKSGTLIFLIVLGYVLKRLGLFKQSDSKMLANIMLYVTLPAILINAFKDFVPDIRLLVFSVVGLAANVIMSAVGWKLGKKEGPRANAMYMLCTSGYNVGSFCVPFIQILFPHMVLHVVMFDVGNTIMTSGMNYSFASTLVDEGDRFTLKKLVKTLLKTFPFDLYMILFLLALLRIPIPGVVYQVADIVAGGNAVVVMLMLGILFEVNLTKTARRQVAEILGSRLIGGILFSLLAFFLLPLPLEQRQVLVLLLMGPMTSMSAVFGAKLDCDPDVYGTSTSLTIALSVIFMVTMFTIWG